MKLSHRNVLACAVLGLASSVSHASIVFSFLQSGANVVMSSSGKLDTTKLVSTTLSTWGGDGFGNFGNYAMLGGTSAGQVDQTFAFHAGTDYSQWAVAGGPFTSNNFSANSVTGTTGFATYVDPAPYTPGIGVETADIVAGLWANDQVWTWNNQTLAGLGLKTGSYKVADALNGESITIQIGGAVIPEPGSLALAGLALAAVGLSRRKRA